MYVEAPCSATDADGVFPASLRITTPSARSNDWGVSSARFGRVGAYVSVNCHVDSHDGFESVVDTHAVWQQVIREEASHHVVLISDDDPDWFKEQFDGAFRALDPTFGLGRVS